MRIIIIFIAMYLSSCSSNVWISQHSVRPKKFKFSIKKTPFRYNILLDTNFLYCSEHKYLINGSYVSVYSYTGFYGDGRMIGSTVYGDSNKILERNSWATANTIGYYNTYGDSVRIQYYVPYDGGQYITKGGTLAEKMIIFREKTLKLFEYDLADDTLLKTKFILK